MRTPRTGLALAVVASALIGSGGAVAAPNVIVAPAVVGRPARAVRVNPPPPPPPPPAPAPDILSSMLDRVNAERQVRGLGPLRYDDRLVRAAQGHSEDQAGRRQMTHDGSDGSTVVERLARVGYLWNSAAENVAYGYPDVATVMAQWMASDVHRRNLLSANTEFGIGLAYSADGRPYWTQVFATPR